MRIDNSKQLEYFIKVISEVIRDENLLKKITKLIDVERIQTFSKKMLLLQWFLYRGDETYQSYELWLKIALDNNMEDGLIQRFSIETNLGLLKDKWGKVNARQEMGKLGKEGIFIRKDMNNYIITEIGLICAKFIYFKILESLMGM